MEKASAATQVVVSTCELHAKALSRFENSSGVWFICEGEVDGSEKVLHQADGSLSLSFDSSYADIREFQGRAFYDTDDTWYVLSGFHVRDVDSVAYFSTTDTAFIAGVIDPKSTYRPATAEIEQLFKLRWDLRQIDTLSRELDSPDLPGGGDSAERIQLQSWRAKRAELRSAVRSYMGWDDLQLDFAVKLYRSRNHPRIIADAVTAIG